MHNCKPDPHRYDPELMVPFPISFLVSVIKLYSSQNCAINIAREVAYEQNEAPFKVRIPKAKLLPEVEIFKYYAAVQHYL
jgi:hypothetical protein